MIDDGDVVYHVAPFGTVARVLACAVGVFLIANGILNLLSLPDLPRRSGLALVVGGPLIGAVCIGWAGLAPEWRWRVRRGQVRIEYHNLFFRWQREFGPDDVKEFDLRKHNGTDGDATWTVVLRPHAGKPLRTRHVNTEQEGVQLLLKIQQAFYGETVPTFYGPAA